MNRFIRPSIIVLFVLLFNSCGGSEGDNITRVLNQCAATSKRAGTFNDNPSRQADFIAREFQKVDVSGCPADFRIAFQAHVLAWQQAAPVFANNNLGTAFIEGLTAGATDDSRFIGQANQQAAYAGQQINDTYATVTMLAAKYGARIPRSVVGEQ